MKRETQGRQGSKGAKKKSSQPGAPEPSARAQGERSESRSEERWGWGPSALIEERGEHY